MEQILLAGSGCYIQGEHILEQIADHMKNLRCSKPYIIGGKKALNAAWQSLQKGLLAAGCCTEPTIFTGHCTDSRVDAFTQAAKSSDCIIGVGGGSCLDTAKATANRLGIPIICIPTSAATCAATTALSVMYSDEGQQIRIDFFKSEVNLVMADTFILSQAPPRLLAAGIADSFAKYCEYSSPYPKLELGQKDIGLFGGCCLASAANQELMSQAREAYLSAFHKTISPSLENCVFVNLALIGIVSGLGGFGGRGGARFAIAHALNEVMRIHYPRSANQWLHGEIVGVGILMQMRANGFPEEEITELKELFLSLDLPATLKQLGFPDGQENLDNLCCLLMKCTNLLPPFSEKALNAIAETAF